MRANGRRIGQAEQVVIPVHDRNPTRHAPVVTWTLIAVNVVVFLLSPAARLPGTTATTANQCSQQAFFLHWGAVPTELVHNDQLPFTAGQPVAPNQCLRVTPDYTKIPALSALTNMFVHAGWLHLIGNMLFLMVFGNNVEDRFGRVRYLLFYLAVGMAATYAFALTGPNSTQPLVGASGAIAGVLGAYLVLWPKAKVVSLVPFLLFIPVRLPAWIVLVFWFVLQAVYAEGAGLGGGGGVAYLVHVFGFILGALVALLYRPHSRPRPPQPYRSPPYRYG
jgi:membrane associated rhomboid family serine protease